MSYYRNNRMPEYAAYGGVPSDEAYGRANGGVPYEEKKKKKRNANGASENRPTLREQLEANWRKIKEREEEERAAEQEEEDEESVAEEEENLAEDEETASDNQRATGADEDFVFGQPSGSSGSDNIDKINDFVKHYTEMHQSTGQQPYGDNHILMDNNRALERFGDNISNIVRKTGIDNIANNLYNFGYDAAERLTNPQSNVQNYDNMSSLGQAQAEAQRLTPVRISDVDKHRYISCVGAYDGPFSVMATAAAGMYKEGKDMYKKWNNIKYGSNMDIINDSIKDLKNDAIGISKGWSAKNIEECEEFLPPYARKNNR